ncbi:MAG: TlpA family protein disulfide reductase [Candidatus Caldatribacteriaceae bacterium]
MRVKFFGFFVVLLVFIFSWAFVGETKEAPTFSLPGLDNKEYSLESLRGRPVVLVFFSTSCVYCRQEMTILEKLYREYKEKALLEVLAINMGDTKEEVTRLIQKMGVSFPVLLDQDVTVALAYRVMYVPTVFFVDPRGNVVDGFVGAQGETVVRSKLDKILWFRGLQEAEVRNLVALTSKVIVLDTRREATNPFASENHVVYTVVQDIAEKLPSLNPQGVYVLLVSSNEEGIRWGIRMVQEGFTRVYYQMVDGTS